MTKKRGIINETKRTFIANDFRVCRSIFCKFLGLMFSRESKILKKALVFDFEKEQRIGLHMFFVFYRIDAVFVDNKHRIVDLKEGMKPFTIYNSHKSSRYVIELPFRRIKESKTESGDVLGWLTK